MTDHQPVRDLIDLTDSSNNLIFNMTREEARLRVASGRPDAVRAIEGHFALVGRQGTNVRMARTLAVPLRYFLAKQKDGPLLIVSHRIDGIATTLGEFGLSDQFHPSYTRMVPAHHVTEIALVGCPDPNPTHARYLSPRQASLPTDLDELGRLYVGALADEIAKWVRLLPDGEPIGACFSGGIDSGAAFLVTYHTLLRHGIGPSRLKAFTLDVDGDGQDLTQARSFLDALGLGLFLEPIEVPRDTIDFRETVRVVEDYKPLDVQAATMMLALCKGIRRRYPNWRHLIDGDGGDENLKDYPIHENPELTIRSVLNNRLLYHEGWGVDAVKHSLTYSGGLSRGCTRGFAPSNTLGFRCFSPFMALNVVDVAEAIPFIDLTGWTEERLYALKAEIVSRGVAAVTGLQMPRFEKRRFQHGAASGRVFAGLFPEGPQAYRRAFQAIYDN